LPSLERLVLVNTGRGMKGEWLFPRQKLTPLLFPKANKEEARQDV